MYVLVEPFHSSLEVGIGGAQHPRDLVEDENTLLLVSSAK